MPVSKLPKEIQRQLTDKQKSVVRDTFLSHQKTSASFKELSDQIDQSLKAKELLGITNIAKLCLYSIQSRHRHLLPVFILDNQPHLVTGYSNRPEATFTFFDGNNVVTKTLKDTLTALKKSQARFSYLTLPSP